ncbi:MAG: hypothetical protein HY393_02085 [Candidatus Diapherotrites archaeon]|nr:hypothetical protein [Candidatus Diapherotrites archaeon]
MNEESPNHSSEEKPCCGHCATHSKHFKEENAEATDSKSTNGMKAYFLVGAALVLALISAIQFVQAAQLVQEIERSPSVFYGAPGTGLATTGLLDSAYSTPDSKESSTANSSTMVGGC